MKLHLSCAGCGCEPGAWEQRTSRESKPGGAVVEHLVKVVSTWECTWHACKVKNTHVTEYVMKLRVRQ